MAPPAQESAYRYTPCNVLTRDQNIVWTSARDIAVALNVHAQALNLNMDGSPITWASTHSGEDAAEWRLADDIEFRKLWTSGTIRPIHKRDIPADRRSDITYYNPVVKEKIKDGKIFRRVRGTVGGDRTNFTGEVTARTASLEVVRTLLNSVVSDDADFMTCDITDYYLGTPMERPEYMRMTKKQISDTIRAEYDLTTYADENGVTHFAILQGMYGLPQAGLLAQKRLVKHLAEHDYHQSEIIPCLFRHAHNDVTFCLVVDDFGVKYKAISGRDHLLDTLRLLYKITVDEQGTQYLGMTIHHDKAAQTISISMPGYIEKLLKRFHEWAGTRKAKSPGIYHTPDYGAAIQYSRSDDTAPLSAKDITTLQAIVGGFLYYTRAVDPTMFHETNYIASMQANATERVRDQAIRLLQYAAAYPNNAVVYRKSKMHVILQTDASYLSRSKSRSVAGGIGYFGDADDPASENGMVLAISSIINVVVSSAGEAEYGAAFIIAQLVVHLRNIATEMGHP
jgi:hypothetical protein